MGKQNQTASLVAAFVFGVLFFLPGAFLLRWVIHGVCPAQRLDQMSDRAWLGALGMSFCSVGVCAMTCAVAGRTVAGKALAAILMAAGLGLVGLAFLVVGIFDPESIQTSFSGLIVVLNLRLNPHFGLGALLFIASGCFLLSRMPKIYKITKKQLDEVVETEASQPKPDGDAPKPAP